jgi:hypothetical protein
LDERAPCRLPRSCDNRGIPTSDDPILPCLFCGQEIPSRAGDWCYLLLFLEVDNEKQDHWGMDCHASCLRRVAIGPLPQLPTADLN